MIINTIIINIIIVIIIIIIIIIIIMFMILIIIIIVIIIRCDDEVMISCLAVQELTRLHPTRDQGYGTVKHHTGTVRPNTIGKNASSFFGGKRR